MAVFVLSLVLSTTTAEREVPIRFTSAQFLNTYEYQTGDVYAASRSIDDDFQTFAISASTATVDADGQTLALDMGSSISGPISVLVTVNIPGVIQQWMQPLRVYLGNSLYERAFECERDVAGLWQYQCLHPTSACRFLTIFLPQTAVNTWMVVNEVQATSHAVSASNIDPTPPIIESAYNTLLNASGINRSATLRVAARQVGQMLPLVVFLHPYTWTGGLWYRTFAPDRSSPQIHMVPEGTRDNNNYPFWNATDACCNLDNAMVDDVAYIETLVRQAIRHHNADPDNVTIIGMSNGAFMVHRLICELPTLFSLAISINGASWIDQYDCPGLRRRGGVFPTIMNVHSTNDQVVPPAGGRVLPSLRDYPSATEVTNRWKTASGCTANRHTLSSALLTNNVVNIDEHFNCSRGNKVFDMALNGQTHGPSLSQRWLSELFRIADLGNLRPHQC